MERTVFMTVQQLRAALERLNGDATVVVSYDNGCAEDEDLAVHIDDLGRVVIVTDARYAMTAAPTT